MTFYLCIKYIKDSLNLYMGSVYMHGALNESGPPNELPERQIKWDRGSIHFLVFLAFGYSTDP